MRSWRPQHPCRRSIRRVRRRRTRPRPMIPAARPARREPELLLPGPQRGREHRAARGRGARGAAAPGRALRDHLRRRRQHGRHGRHRGPARRRAPGRGAGRSITASTRGMAPPSGAASAPPGTRSSASPTVTASSASRTSAVCWTGCASRSSPDVATLPDVVVGYRIKRADPPIRLAYARVYRACLRVFFGLRVRDVDCACKLFRREALEDIRLTSGGAFLSAELLIKLRALRRTVVEVGVPHHPTDRRPRVGRRPARRVAGGARLLAAPAAALGAPARGAPDR